MIGKGCLAQAEVMYGSHSASLFSIFWLQNRPYRPVFPFSIVLWQIFCGTIAHRLTTQKGECDCFEGQKRSISGWKTITWKEESLPSGSEAQTPSAAKASPP